MAKEKTNAERVREVERKLLELRWKEENLWIEIAKIRCELARLEMEEYGLIYKEKSA